MKRFAILGYPLGHTLSPKLHRLLAEQLGEQIEYSICAIPPEELEKKKKMMAEREKNRPAGAAPDRTLSLIHI